MTHGTRPTAVQEPTQDGYYWAKIARMRYIYIPTRHDKPTQSYSTWEDCETVWEILELSGGNWNAMGDDCGFDFASNRRVVVKIQGPIPPPED